MGLINGARKDYYEMKEKDSGLLLFGKIAVTVAVICCIVFTIYMSRFLMIPSVIPAIIFCVLAFTKDYKKLAVCTFIVCISLAIISWIIITIRWYMLWNGVANDISDAMEGVNEAFEDFSDIYDIWNNK